MNETKRTEIVSYFQEQITRCKAREQALTSDDRADEAVFAKIQGNVYDIFSSIFSAAVNSCGTDDEKVGRFFLTKLRQIPQNWHASLKKAEVRNETEKAHIEHIKLNTAAEIQEVFQRIWEVTT